MFKLALSAAVTLALPTLTLAADWNWQWSGTAVPQAEVTTFKYGKTWAYTVEIDDTPVSTLTVSQPLLAQYTYTDAPPGIAGGTVKPFVGGASIIARAVSTPNNTVLNWDNLRTLQQKGWGALNHGYSHIGQWWDPVYDLTDAQFKSELFWSQAVIAKELGKAPTHFVYPNGYIKYGPYLNQFGMRSASRVGGPDPSNGFAYAANASWLDLSRSYLDGSSWPAMESFPVGGPGTGQVVIDFTHGMDANPASTNRTLWATRLNTIASTYGKAGNDSVWSAPTGDIYDYAAARKAAVVKVESGKLTLSLPDTLAATPLTLKLTGIPADVPLAAPEGGTLYRSGETVWVTTPGVETGATNLALPQVERIYAGPVEDFNWDQPINLAAIRLMQFGDVAANYALQMDATRPDGTVQSLVPAGQEHLDTLWGAWRLYDLIPNGEGLPITALTLNRDRALTQMEVWAVIPEPTTLGFLAVSSFLLVRRKR